MADNGRPLEVVIARRRSSGKQKLVSVLCLAGYLVAVKVFEDVQTGSWQHSGLHLRLLELRERAERLLAERRERAGFAAAIRQTLDQIDTVNVDTTEEVES